MPAKSESARRADELDAHFAERRAAGLPAHRQQEHKAVVNGVHVHTLAGVAYVKTDGEQELDQSAVFALIRELEAVFQAVS
jgi:hypothetical protein